MPSGLVQQHHAAEATGPCGVENAARERGFLPGIQLAYANTIECRVSQNEEIIMTNQGFSVTAPRIEFRNVSLAFGQKVVLDDVSFRVMPGEMKVILGQSGSGKSTILRLALGLLKPDAGAIFINGEEIASLAEEDLGRVRQQMSIVFQEGALFDSLSVFENIAYRPRELKWPEARLAERVQQVLAFADLVGVADQLPSALFGRERNGWSRFARGDR